MIDSMPYHAQSWIEFARRHRLAIELDDLMRRTPGRTGTECLREVFGRDVPPDKALAGRHVVVQASDYHQLTNKNFLESLHA